MILHARMSNPVSRSQNRRNYTTAGARSGPHQSGLCESINDTKKKENKLISDTDIARRFRVSLTK